MGAWNGKGVFFFPSSSAHGVGKCRLACFLLDKYTQKLTWLAVNKRGRGVSGGVRLHMSLFGTRYSCDDDLERTPERWKARSRQLSRCGGYIAEIAAAAATAESAR